MAACPAYDPASPAIMAVHQFVDCQARAIGMNGYAALSAPGSPVILALGGGLAIFVALWGYRLLLGQGATLRESALAVVKIGLALTLATQWPAYQALAYDLVISGPAQIAAQVVGGSDLGEAAPEFIAARLQGVHDRLTIAAERSLRPPAPVAASVGPPMTGQGPPALDKIGERRARVLDQAATVLMSASLAILLGPRIVAGILLALGPLFALLMLFAATRGLFVGWLRALAGVFLAGVAGLVLSLVQLAVAEPQAAAALAEAVGRADQAPSARAAGVALATSLVFALLGLTAIAAAFVVARGLRLPAGLSPGAQDRSVRPSEKAPSPAAANPASAPSRAQAVANAVAVAAERRSSPSRRLVGGGGREGDTASLSGQPSSLPGQRTGRRTALGRASQRATRRDASA